MRWWWKLSLAVLATVLVAVVLAIWFGLRPLAEAALAIGAILFVAIIAWRLVAWRTRAIGRVLDRQRHRAERR